MCVCVCGRPTVLYCMLLCVAVMTLCVCVCVAGRPTVLYCMLLCVAVMTSRQPVLLEKEFLELDGAEVLRVAVSRLAVLCHSYRCALHGCSRCRD